MKRVFVSGAITPTGKGNHALEFLANVKKGVQVSVDLICAGYSVYCPFTDLHYWLQLREDQKLTVEMIYKADLAMLEVCDALLLVPGWQASIGVSGEVAKAEKLGIPVFTSISDLQKGLDA